MKHTLEEAAYQVIHRINESRVFNRSDDIKDFILRNKDNLEGTRVRFTRYTPSLGGGSGGERNVEGVIEKVWINTNRDIFTKKSEEYPQLVVRTSSRETETVHSHEINNFEVL